MSNDDNDMITYHSLLESSFNLSKQPFKCFTVESVLFNDLLCAKYGPDKNVHLKITQNS